MFYKDSYRGYLKWREDETILPLQWEEDNEYYLLRTHGTASNLAIASGYDMNARPVPPPPMTSATSTFNSCAKFPSIPNIVAPASSDVNVSNVVTTKASL